MAGSFHPTLTVNTDAHTVHKSRKKIARPYPSTPRTTERVRCGLTEGTLLLTLHFATESAVPQVRALFQSTEVTVLGQELWDPISLHCTHSYK